MYKVPKQQHHASFHYQRNFVNSSYLNPRNRQQQSPVSIDINNRRRSGGNQQNSYDRQSPNDPALSPRPFFKKPPPSFRHGHQGASPQQDKSDQSHHHEMVRFLQQTWDNFLSDQSQEDGTGEVKRYTSQGEVPSDFKPFDLDQWYKERLLKAVNLDPREFKDV